MTAGLVNIARDIAIPNMQGNIYIGIVEDNDDPEERHRIRARCKYLNDQDATGDLVWCLPKSMAGPQANSGGMGGVSIPHVGTKVMLEMQDNSGLNPVYSGAPTSDDVRLSELMEDYPHSYGNINSSNDLTITNTKQGYTKHYHHSGTVYTVSNDGSINIITAAKIDIQCNGPVNIQSSGLVNLWSTGNVDIRGARIDLNLGGATAPQEAEPR